MMYTMLLFDDIHTDRVWGVFPELDSVSSFGDSVRDAQRNTTEAAALWLEGREPPEILGHSEVVAFAELVPIEQFRGIAKINF